MKSPSTNTIYYSNISNAHKFDFLVSEPPPLPAEQQQQQQQQQRCWRDNNIAGKENSKLTALVLVFVMNYLVKRSI